MMTAMKYELDNGRIITIPDAEIQKLQKNLEISENEAIYTWLVDNDYETDSTVEELSEKAKKNRITATIHQAKTDKKQKKERKPREKKENLTKKLIIDALLMGLEETFGDSATIFVKNAEKYIDLTLCDGNFTINLVQHREKH